MKITLLHPSRGRANKARATLDHWLSRAEKADEIEHILSCDADDPELELYKSLFRDGNIWKHEQKMVIAENNNVVEATNKAAELATGDIIVYLSDDFECHDNWDRNIDFAYVGHGSPECWLLRVDDCLQHIRADVLTIPIMTKKLMDHLTYFWHPSYKSMFVDQDLFYTVQKNGWLYYAPDLKFPHLHYCNGGAVNDETYQRSARHWDEGKKLYHQRMAAGFPLMQ